MGTYRIFWKLFLFVDRFEQNLHSICKMKNKIYFALDIFPVFFVVFFLFTILWTNYNKIVFTQIPKFSQVLPEITIYKNSNFIQLSPLSPPIVEKLNQI